MKQALSQSYKEFTPEERMRLNPRGSGTRRHGGSNAAHG
jgi:hypothetical protein